MKRDDESFDEKTSGEEDLLNFEFDELSEEEVPEAAEDSTADEDVIELVDIVEEGDMIEDSESDEIAKLLDEEEAVEKELTLGTPEEGDLETASEESEDLTLEFSGDLKEFEVSLAQETELESLGEPGLTDILEKDSSQGLEPDPTTGLGSLDVEETMGPEAAEEEIEIGPEEVTSEEMSPAAAPEFLSPESPLPETAERETEPEVEEESIEEVPLDFQELAEAEDLQEVEGEQTPFAEPVEEPAVELPKEDLSELLESPEEEPQLEGAMLAPAAEGSIGISEEKIEAIITRVVEEVVERVARETMASVAERVITEAIDALKQSLESTPS